MLFPECEAGAMPPFGPLYGMDTYVAARLADDEYIAFNAGTHTELIRMRYRDFARLADPKVLAFAR
jgi:Ala-tRNA(Pro) deacylase